MKIYNESKTKILETYDVEKGYLKADKIFKEHHEAVPEVPAITVQAKAAAITANGGKVENIGDKYYEVVAEFSNGGKTVKEIIETPAIPAKEAYDEYEDIQVYVPYTAEELAEIKRADIRRRRVLECFSVINRGKLWYDRLTVAEEIELTDWYNAWLDAPETLTVPVRPAWIDNKIKATEEV